MQQQRSVKPSFENPIAFLDLFTPRGLQPVAFDRSGHTDDLAANLEHHEELSAAVVDLARERGAGP